MMTDRPSKGPTDKPTKGCNVRDHSSGSQTTDKTLRLIKTQQIQDKSMIHVRLLVCIEILQQNRK